jgi:putative membrane protein
VVLIVRLLASAAALAVAAALVEGIAIAKVTTTEGLITLLGVALIFGLINTFVRPIVRLLTLPLFILTLGLFTFVVNALMLLLTSAVSDRLDLSFRVDGFGAALFGALVVSVVSFLINVVLPDKYES